MSLRDQLLQAGLVTQKQVNEAERQLQREAQQQRQAQQKRPLKQQRPPAVPPQSSPPQSQSPPPGRERELPNAAVRPPPPLRSASAQKFARDHALNLRHQEKAKKKALQAEIQQLVEQHRLPPIESGDFYNFIDGTRIRNIPVNAELRARLVRGELVIVRSAGRYALAPSGLAPRIRERDPTAVMPLPSESDAAIDVVRDAAYQSHPIPDDLIW